MRLPWKRKKQISESAEEAITPTASSPVPFGGDLEDFTILRYHAVRALCGMLMDRHTACQSPHPFCNPGHRQDGYELQMFVAEVVPQGTKDTGYADLIGIYLCPAVAPKGSENEEDIMQFIAGMAPSEAAPTRKLVVSSPKDGIYPAVYGPIINPVAGDYSTGSIDSDNSRPVNNCNSEPRHCRWQYWESDLNEGDWQVPRYHCLQVFGQWWLVEMDRGRGRLQQVAGLQLADSPEHNFGIHSGKFKKGDVIAHRSEGELATVLRENWG